MKPEPYTIELAEATWVAKATHIRLDVEEAEVQ